jgi:hypothetical protein
MAMAVSVSSREELEAWLENKPREWAQVIAPRAALRVLPLCCDPDLFRDRNVDPRLPMAVLRASTISSGAHDATPDDIAYAEFAQSAGRAANAAGAVAEAYGSAAAAYAAAATGTTAYAAAAEAYAATGTAAYADAAATAAAYAATGTAAYADAAAYAAVWRIIQSDCQSLDEGVTPEKLLRLHLWPEAPDWWSEAWDRARRWLSRPEDGFEIWREWYYGRIEGLPHAFGDFDDEADTAFYRWIVQQDDEWWSREPREVNADIKAKVDGLRAPPHQPKADFFISYAEGDEAILAQLLHALEALGKTSITPYRGGSDLVYPDASEGAERFIALYSENYMRSQACQTEWMQAYLLDVETVEKRMIAFRFDHADLKPLMNGLSFHDLSRVPPARRKDAMAKWVEWKPLPLSRDNVEQTLTKVLDPAVIATKDGKLDTVPDPVLNRAELPSELANAMNALRLMLDLARLGERNLSSMMQGALRLYDDHFTQRGKDSSWGGLDRYMTVLAEGAADLSGGEMREEKAALEQLVAAHGQCMDALGSLDEQMRELANVPIGNADQQAIDGLIDALRDFRDQTQEHEASTEDYDQQITALVDQGRDFAFEAGKPDADVRPDIARKRFLRYVGGFGIKTLSILGSLASIRSTDEAESLARYAKKVVDKFFEMIGL